MTTARLALRFGILFINFETEVTDPDDDCTPHVPLGTKTGRLENWETW